MGRLVVVLLAVLAVIMIARFVDRAIMTAVNSKQEASVPKTAKTISYLLLIVLMFGVVTGWLGGL